jgi:hypothetical protein
LAVLGAIVMLTGALSMLSGQLEYPNYFHDPAFAPFAVVGGLVVILVAVKKK